MAIRLPMRRRAYRGISSMTRILATPGTDKCRRDRNSSGDDYGRQHHRVGRRGVRYPAHLCSRTIRFLFESADPMTKLTSARFSASLTARRLSHPFAAETACPVVDAPARATRPRAKSAQTGGRPVQGQRRASLERNPLSDLFRGTASTTPWATGSPTIYAAERAAARRPAGAGDSKAVLNPSKIA